MLVTTQLKGGAIVAALAKSYKANQIFEFGTHMGFTAIEVARNCPNATIVTLDLPETLANDFKAAQEASGVEITDSYLFANERGSAIVGEGAERITQLREDSAKFDPKPYSKRFDLIYIDASHSYSAVKSDSGKALTMIKDNGTIIWDDYSYPGVWKYVTELAAKRSDRQFIYIYGQ